MLKDVVLEELKKILRFVKPSGNDNVGGPCPFHKGGMEKSPSFYVNLNNGLYFCHACGEKGTFVQLLKRTGSSAQKIELVTELAKEAEAEKPPKASNHRSDKILSEAILGALDYCPQELLDAGFEEKTLRELDVGFDKEYMRITFPIRDLYGMLVGIAGRTVTDAIPRYLVYRPQDLNRFAPADDPNKYGQHNVKNHNYLWNMHNVYPDLFYTDLDAVVVVEGYKACMWMIQNTIDNTVAFMGSRMSFAQESQLCKFSGTIYLCLDNNKAGRDGTNDAARRLTAKGQKVRVFNYPDYVEEGTQPDNLDKQELLTGLDTALPPELWRKRHGIHSTKQAITS